MKPEPKSIQIPLEVYQNLINHLTHMKVGEKLGIPCFNDDCAGSLEGTCDGDFSVGETKIKYTQIRNCKCDRCDLELAEAFEVWDEYNQEYWVSDRVSVPLTDESDISFSGLGMPAVKLSPEFFYFLRTGQKL